MTMTTSKRCSMIITYFTILGSFIINQVPFTTAIENTRLILLKDALSWMTFKKEGILMDPEPREQLFLDTILSKYSKSKFYRVFVIQFQLGVLPKLTLNEGASCDPSYTWKYKDPWNSSVTWHYQKQFVAESYRNRNNANLKYCDYPQGLICNQFTRKCECPEGSKMQQVSVGSPVKRCLLEENEICALIDIDHGRDPTHGTLARDLPKLMFNLEKPPSCKVSTQCRFTNGGGFRYPRCYDRNLGKWLGQTSYWLSQIGCDCTIGLYANPGHCDLYSGYAQSEPPPGLICYNFGPPSNSDPRSSNRTGYCAHELGSFANVRGYTLENDGKIHLIPQFSFIGYVHARSTPLRSANLTEYYKKYNDGYFPVGAQVDYYERCSTKKTERVNELWKYFAGLEKPPPQGQDYVPEATQPELEKKLDEILTLSRFVSNAKFCRPHAKFDENNNWKYEPPRNCVGDGNPPDVNGNDGACKEDPGNVVTKPAFDRFSNYLKHAEEVFRAEREEDKLTPELEQILEENKDACEKGRNDCPQGFWCYEDLRDEQGSYDDMTCNFKDPSQITPICHDLSEDPKSYGNCEGKQLDERIRGAFEEIVNHPNKLGRGDKCQVHFEKEIRESIGKNRPVYWKYKMLSWLENEKNGKGKGLCDHTKLLFCSNITGNCECLDGTEPRKVTLNGMEFQSDYCYKTSGDSNCGSSSLAQLYQTMTMSEKGVLAVHYGTPDKNCKYTNICVFVTKEKLGVCTTRNTGFTGGEVSPTAPPGNGWAWAGTIRTTGIGNYWNIAAFILIIISLV